MQSDSYTLIIGSSNIDLNIYSEKFPKAGETVTGGTFSQSFGGKGANQAIAAVRAGSKTKFIGRVGNDSFGKQMLINLKKEGIDVEHVIVDQKNPSGVAFILLNSHGQNMITVAPGANALVSLQEIRNIKAIIRKAAAVIVQMEIPMKIILEIFQSTLDKTITVLNPAPFKPIPKEVLERLKVITPNENEIFDLHSSLGFSNPQTLDEKSLELISKNISKFGVENIVTTLGSRGCFVYQSNTDEVTSVPGIKVSAVDTVGAGDCFNGVLTSYIGKGYNVVTAAKYANVAASIAVTRRGAQSSIPFESEIQMKFKHHYS